MSRVDLNKNRESLLAAHKEVCDLNSSINWVVVGYEGTSVVLKVVEKGDGDLDEMVEEMSSGKIMYAFFRVQDPNTSLYKFVLVHWQGEGVPEQKKGSYASHIRDVRDFFRGAHITISARNEDDLDEDDIKDKVAKSSGSNYSFHKEKAVPLPEASPVSSVYKKTLPHAEIRPERRDKFWEKQQEEERKRRDEDEAKAMQERQRLDQERKQREEAEAVEREKRESERMKKIREMKAAEAKANAPSGTDADKWDDAQREGMRDEEERRKRSEMMRKQRQAEAASLVQKRGANPRAMFEQNARSQFDKPSVGARPPPPRKLKHGFMQDENQDGRVGPKPPIQLPTAEPEFDRPSLPQSATAAPASVAPSVPSAGPRKPPAGAVRAMPMPSQPEPQVEPPREPSPEPVRPPALPPREPSPEPVREPSPEPVREPSPEPVRPPPLPVSQPTSQLPPTRNLLKDTVPKRQNSSDEEEDEDDWGEEESQSKPQAVIAPVSAYQEEPAYEEAQPVYEPVADSYPAHQEQQYQPEQDDDVYENTEMNPQAQTPEFGPEHGLVARALYDYQAEDDTEITFDPDDYITNIDMIDEGWWTGVGPDGHHGMFPANYVETING